jgi:glutamate synthase (NADPH/NADH) large chain
MEKRLAKMCAEVSAAIEAGAQFIVLSDRDSEQGLRADPVAADAPTVHHHLIREKNRMKVGIVVEAGDVREVHHVALLIGYGASRGQPVPRDGDRRGTRRAAA